jgi:transcriptional regulator with GAF, ATPase, and Fis domain
MNTAITKNSRPPLQRSNIKDVIARDQLISLRQLTLELQQQLEALNQSPSTKEGTLDFYIEVQRFEIALIKQALRVTGGRQTKAAQLLNLNSTTLNAMIKRYRIKF